MVKVSVGDELVSQPLKLRVRFDYKGVSKPGRFGFGGKNVEQVAEEAREQKVALLRNVPIQGIQVENIDLNSEVYVVHDEISGTEVAYAPVQLLITAGGLEDVIKLIMREEFRKIEVLEPDQMIMTRHDVERFLFRTNEELRAYRSLLERKVGSK